MITPAAQHTTCSIDGTGISCPSRPSLARRLANGYFSRHPLRGMSLLFLGFVLACSVAPAFELLLEGL